MDNGSIYIAENEILFFEREEKKKEKNCSDPKQRKETATMAVSSSSKLNVEADFFYCRSCFCVHLINA